MVREFNYIAFSSRIKCVSLTRSSRGYLMFSIITSSILMNGCGHWGGDENCPPATTILDVIVTPDSVSVGDTVSIHVIVSDSMSTELEYFWSGVDSDSATAFWKAEPRDNDYEYKGVITITRLGCYENVGRIFTVWVFVP